MPPRQQLRASGPDSYQSASCRIGTHHACAESSPAIAPVDVPVIYEACDCPCHSITTRPAPTEAAR